MKAKELYPLTFIKQFTIGEYGDRIVTVESIETKHALIFITTTARTDTLMTTNVKTSVVKKGGRRGNR
jgi:hypothetical protein